MKPIVLFFILFFTITSCKKDANIEQFMVNRQENQNIISFDLTPNMLQFKEGMNTTENLELLKTVKKANIMLSKIDTVHKNTYTQDIQVLKQIISHKKYQELMRYGKGANTVKILTVGESDSLNEVLIVGNDETKGWGIARITGNNMNPEQLLSLLDDIKWNDKKLNLEQIESFLK